MPALLLPKLSSKASQPQVQLPCTPPGSSFGINMYFSEAASMHAAILNNFISSYFSDAVLGATPLIVTEYGRPSSSPYTPAIQADVVQVESSTFKTMATGSQYPRFLGSCVFVYSDSSFGGADSAMGLRSYSGTFTTINTPGGQPYRLDQWANKPAFTAYASTTLAG
eukprot:jgi/Chrzof1/14874/Cz09g19050.t1